MTAAAEQAERLFAASLPQVCAVLLDPLGLPDWNPAFTTTTGPQQADTRHEYRITARGLPGSFAYEAIEPLTVLDRLAHRLGERP